MMPRKDYVSRSYPRRPSRGLVRALGFGLVLLALAPAAGAKAQFTQYLVNDELLGEENRFDPAAIPLANGNLTVLWVDNSRGHTDIVARNFDADLQPLGDLYRVNTDSGFWSQRDMIASQAGGGVALAVWLDGRDGGNDLYAQLFSSQNGSLIGGNLRLNMDDGQGVQAAPAAAVNGSGRTLVCWMDNRTGPNRIWARFVESNGTVIGEDFQVAPENPGNAQRYPGVAALPDGRWLVAYDELGGPVYQVSYRILEADGSPDEAPRPVGAFLADQEEPAVIVRSDDALIAWIDNRSGQTDVWGLWIDHDGEPDGGAILLREEEDSPRDINPRLALGDDDVVAASWFGGIEDRQRTLIRFFDQDRDPLTGDLLMSDPPSGVTSRQGSIVPLQNGGWLMAWADDRSLTQQVYLDTIEPPQGPSGSPVQAYSLPGSASQIFPDVALFPDGRAVVVWGDIRNGSLNVFCRFLDDTGQPEGNSFQVNALPVLRRIAALDGIQSLTRFAPSVAASDSSFVVTWAIDAQGGRLDLYAQLYDREGQPIGGNFPVVSPTPPTWPQYDPSPGMAPDGRFGIAWRDDRVEDAGDIFVQLFDEDGARLGGNLLLVDGGGPRNAPQQNPSLAMSPFDFVVSWIDRRGLGWDIWRQRLPLNNPDPEDIQNEILHPADDAATDQLYPSTDTNGEAVVTIWETKPLTGGSIDGRLEIFETKAGTGLGETRGSGLRLDGSQPPAVIPGRMSGTLAPRDGLVDFRVNDGNAVPGIKRPHVSMDPLGRFVVTWWDNRDGETKVWAQRYDEDGNPIEGPYEIDEQEDQGSRLYPKHDVDRNIIQFVWTDSRRSRGWDIYARRVDWEYDGTPVPITLHYLEAEAAESGPRILWSVSDDVSALQFRLWRDLASSGQPGSAPSGEAVLVTPVPVDPVEGGRFEFVDQGAPSGLPLLYYLEAIHPFEPVEFYGPVAVRWDASPAALRWEISPNPFRDRLELYPPDAGPALLEIWDVAGRQVLSTEVPAEPGTPVVWSGKDGSGRQVPAGIYFVRPTILARSAQGGKDAGPDISAYWQGPVFKVLRVR